MTRLFTLLTVLFFTVTLHAQELTKGTYSCCRNTFVLTVNGSNYKLSRHTLGIDDRNTTTTTIKGKIIKTDKGYVLKPTSYLTTKTLYSKKYKKKIPMKFDTPKSFKNEITIVWEEGNFYWKYGENKQQLYPQ